MEELLDTILLAICDGASDDERRSGIAACRAVAEALEGGLVDDVATTPLEDSANNSAAPTTTATIAAVTPPLVANPAASNPFSGMTADQILELAIAKLRGAVGENAAPSPAGQPFRLTLVPVPRFP
jgi:hypothetical protein